MNNKGFTTVELILTMLLVVIIMATITNVTYAYRDRSNYEETLTEVTDYKNTLTRIIYADILNPTDNVVSIEKVTDYTYNLVTASNKKIPLVIDTGGYQSGIIYDDVFFEMPGTKQGLISIDIENVQYKADVDKGIYSLDIIFFHQNLDEVFKIHFAVS